jgi:hypothetical protein
MTETSSIVDHASSIPTHFILAFLHLNKPILLPKHIQPCPALMYSRFVLGVASEEARKKFGYLVDSCVCDSDLNDSSVITIYISTM